MVSIIAAATPIMASSLASINAFEELPPLPAHILFSPSSPVIPLAITISDDLEVDELISEVTETMAFVSKTPLQISFAHAAHLLRSRQVKTPYHIISKSPPASPAPPSAPPDSSNGLIVSMSVCRRNPTISIQPVAGSSRKRGQCKEEPPVMSFPPKKPYHNKVHQSFLFFFSFISLLIVFSSF